MAKKITASDTTADCDPRDISGETLECLDKRALHTAPIRGAQVPSGSMAFNFIIEHLMAGRVWDNVDFVRSDLSDTEDIIFYNGVTRIETIRIECTEDGTTVNLGVPEYMLKEDGDFLLQENGDRIIL